MIEHTTFEVSADPASNSQRVYSVEFDLSQYYEATIFFNWPPPPGFEPGAGVNNWLFALEQWTGDSGSGRYGYSDTAIYPENAGAIVLVTNRTFSLHCRGPFREKVRASIGVFSGGAKPVDPLTKFTVIGAKR